MSDESSAAYFRDRIELNERHVRGRRRAVAIPGEHSCRGDLSARSARPQIAALSTSPDRERKIVVGREIG